MAGIEEGRISVRPEAHSAAPIGRCLIIADDHVMVLDMLAPLLAPYFGRIATASSGDALLRAASELDPDMILLDIGMPELDGLEAAKQLRAAGSGARLAFLSMDATPEIAARAFMAGASAYVAKTGRADEVLRALRTVAAGDRYLTPTIHGGDIAALLAEYGVDPVARLSAREREVLRLAVRGLSMKAAARQLGITPRTIAFHKYRAMQALGLRDNAALVEFAARHGLGGRARTVHGEGGPGGEELR